MKTRKQRKSIEEVRSNRIVELKVKEQKKIVGGGSKGVLAVSGRNTS